VAVKKIADSEPDGRLMGPLCKITLKLRSERRCHRRWSMVRESRKILGSQDKEHEDIGPK
jgi:hypothetical protein